MAFNPTTEDLWLEVEAAIHETEEHVAVAADIMRRLTGRWYRQDMNASEPEPENFNFAFVSNVLPQLGRGNPEVSIRPARVIGHRAVGQAIEDGSNAWSEDVGFAELIEPVHFEYLVIRGVAMVYLDEDTRFSRGVVTPAIKRIPVHRFFLDALADDAATAQFRGHWYWKDLDELRADPDADQDVVARLIAGDDREESEATAGGERVRAAWKKRSGSQLGRQRVKCYNVWLRERNTLRVLVDGDRNAELYPEREFYGPRTGPYVLYDAFPIPGQAWPLTTLIAVQDQNRDLNVHAQAMGRAAARRKRLGLVEANNPDLGQKLANAEDGEIIPVKGITGNYVQVELDGATDQQYTFTEYIRNRLDRISGMTATVQGSVGEADTATEAQIASDALNNRIGYIKRRALRCTEHVFRAVGWYLWHTEGIVIPVNRRDPYSGELLEGLFFGGPSPQDGLATWDDMQLKVRVNTLQSEAEARQNLLTFYDLFITIAQMAPSMPWVRWMTVLRDLADGYELGDKAEEWIIPELFGAFGQPPMFPVSQVIGGRQVPQQGTPPNAGWARRSLLPNLTGAMPTPGGNGANAEGPAAPGGVPTNPTTRAGNVRGPQPARPGGRR